MKLDDLPELLRLLADPTTPYTAIELSNRIAVHGWGECTPVIMHQLLHGEPCVKQLVLSVLCYESNQLDSDRVQLFFTVIVDVLRDPDRLVRMSAILAVRGLQLHEAIPQLRRIACDDERVLAAEALTTLMELDDDLIDDLIEFVREKW